MSAAKTIKLLIEKNYEVNLVNCGNCGSIHSHPVTLVYSKGKYKLDWPCTIKTNKEWDLLKCLHCGFEWETCDFPDFFT